MPDWTPAGCRQRLESAAARLSLGATAAERDAVKAELSALLRIVEHQTAEYAALRADLERAARRWRELGAGDGTPRAGAPATARADHLGASTFIEKGWAHIARAEYEAAEADLTRALDLVTDDPTATALLAWALMHQGQYDRALASSQRVLQRIPDHAIARVNIGYICLRRGAYGEAIEHLTRAIHESADRKAVLYANYYLGLVYLEREMYRDAIRFLRAALELGPNLAEAWFDLGRTHWLAGERERACAVWREGARAHKFSVWARRCEDALERAEGGDEPLRVVA
jgi:tetratricopeptide (TPR) repeat protein